MKANGTKNGAGSGAVRLEQLMHFSKCDLNELRPTWQVRLCGALFTLDKTTKPHGAPNSNTHFNEFNPQTAESCKLRIQKSIDLSNQ